MLRITENANRNYLAKIVKISNLRKHPNADRLQITSIDFQDVITGPETKEGDMFVFFPVECVINLEYLSSTNSFRKPEMNSDKEATPGFFEEKGRVRALKLRGEKSYGYLAPLETVETFFNVDLSEHAGEEFDAIGDVVVVKKYVVPSRTQGLGNGRGKKPKVSRLIDNQVRLHVDTENLRKNIMNISPNDRISVSYKYHGTSFWVAHVLAKKKLGVISRLLSFLGADICTSEYDFIYGSRKVVKNGDLGGINEGYYKHDLWGDIKDEIKHLIPKGFTIYGECVGYLPSGSEIQTGYDYGCRPGEKRILVYRITYTNVDGFVFDLSTSQVKAFCDLSGLDFVHLFYVGKAKNMYPEIAIDESWHKNFINQLEKDYNDKNCFLCANKVPEEGIVLRKEKLSSFIAFKLKSFSFLEYETKLLDSGDTNIEDETV